MAGQTDTTHECPAPACLRRVPRQQFACRGDWFRLPLELRRVISGNYRRDPGAHVEAMAEAMEWYEQHPLAVE